MLLMEETAANSEIIKFVKLYAQYRALCEYQDCSVKHPIVEFDGLTTGSIIRLTTLIEELFASHKDSSDWLSMTTEMGMVFATHIDVSLFKKQLTTIIEVTKQAIEVNPDRPSSDTPSMSSTTAFINFINSKPLIKVIALTQRLLSELIVAEMGRYVKGAASQHNPLDGYYPNEESQMLQKLLEGKK